MSAGEVQIRVLGPVEVVDGSGEVLSLPPQPTRLLALLAAADGSVSRDQVAEYVIDGDPAGSAVRTCVSRLRKVLGDRLVRSGTRYRLDLGACGYDAHRFETLVRSAAGRPADERAERLGEAVALWRGPAFGDLAGEHWALPAAARLDAARAQAVEDLAEALIDSDLAVRAVPLLEAHVIDRPLEEGPVALLMRALAHTGRVAEATRVFQRLRAELVEAGLEPSQELAKLERRILAGTTEPAEPGTGDVALPTGTVTFLFTDVVGSTRLWDRQRDAMAASLRRHDEIVPSCLTETGGHIFSHAGDGWAAAFASPRAAIDAATAIRERLGAIDWPGPPLAVRIGLHIGEPEMRDDDYFGTPVNVAARVAAAAAGGQVVATGAVRDSVGFDGVDLGSHHLRGLSDRIHLWQIGTGGHTPLRADALIPVRLPAPRTGLVGRDEALTKVAEMMGASRLVTITGVGGAGKTRLAVEAARRTVGAFPAGVHFVDLTVVDHPSRVREEFVRSLGVDEVSDDIDPLVAARASDPLLFVVDNCEHVLDPVAELIDGLLEGFESLHVLATSREALEIDGERTLRLRSLETGAGGAAVELFVQRARAARPDFDPDDDALSVVAEICGELDGMPLAIEMAAARLRSMTLTELRGRLDERFELLSGGRRRARRRQQTLDAVVAWSYDLLDADEQRVLRRLAVFAGSFDADLVAAVCETTASRAAQILDSLVAKSLVEFDERDGQPRFSLLETIRLYAADRLLADDEPVSARRRLADALIDRWYRGPDTVVDAIVALDELVRFEADSDGLARAAQSCLDQRDWLGAARLLRILTRRATSSIDQAWSEAIRRAEVRQELGATEPDLLSFIERQVAGSRYAAHLPPGALRDFTANVDARELRRLEDAGWRIRPGEPQSHLMRYVPELVPGRLDELVAWADDLDLKRDGYGRWESAAVGMALAGNFERACATLKQLEPDRGTPGTLAFWGSTTSYLHSVAGRPERALEIMDETEVPISTNSALGMRRMIARTVPMLCLDRIDEAVGPFVADTKTRNMGPTGRAGTYLAVFALVHHLVGNRDRAELLIDHTVKRLLADYLIICHIKSIVAGWPTEEFRDRWTHWHDTHTVVGDLPGRCETMRDLAQEEIRYWS